LLGYVGRLEQVCLFGRLDYLGDASDAVPHLQDGRRGVVSLQLPRCHQRCNQRRVPRCIGVHSGAHPRAEPRPRKSAKRLGRSRFSGGDLKSGRPTGILDASVKLTPCQISRRSVPSEGRKRPRCHHLTPKSGTIRSLRPLSKPPLLGHLTTPGGRDPGKPGRSQRTTGGRPLTSRKGSAASSRSKQPSPAPPPLFVDRSLGRSSRPSWPVGSNLG
jgi:hypothetical protein